MPLNGHIKNINVILKARYGCNLRGQPLFRMVWSTDETEVRFGKYEEHCGQVFLRTFVGLKEVPKYGYVKDRFILEQWAPPEKAYTRDIPETSQGSYEPVWVFQHENGQPVPVEERIVHHIVYDLQHPQLEGHRRSILKSEEQELFDREVANTVLHLEELGSATKVHGRAIE